MMYVSQDAHIIRIYWDILILFVSHTLEIHVCSGGCMNNVHMEILTVNILYIHIDMCIMSSLYT